MALNMIVEADTNAPPVTRTLAKFVAEHPTQGWSTAVEHEAHRTFINWVGCAIGASRHPTLERALAAVNELDPAAQAALLGRSERVDIGNAALLNGISSHTFDFDDTHLKTIIHPAGPVASAILALAEKVGSSGREIVDALVLGIDISCRLGNMVYPDHYDRGWHITGSTGMMGAAAACARLLHLSPDQTAMALGIAASQPVGLREQFGTMTKPLHPGAAARAGMMSALMAKHGFTASPQAIEAPRGFAQVTSTKFDWHEAVSELGERFEISFNTYKPFACGIVIHPSIDACVRLRDDHGLKVEDIAEVRLKVHGLVLELTGKRAPRNGLEAKFSVYHGCAVGLAFGTAGETEFSDEVVNRPDIIELRNKVSAEVDNNITEEAAAATVICKDGRTLQLVVDTAVGSIQSPMSNAQLNKKFDTLVSPVLGAEKCEMVKGLCWSLADQANVNELLRHACV